jgi:hypothetical protein
MVFQPSVNFTFKTINRFACLTQLHGTLPNAKEKVSYFGLEIVIRA